MSAASAVGIVINFIIFGFASGVIGKVFDFLTVMMNRAGETGITMDAFNTISNLHLIYISGPFLYALALVYNHIITSNRERGGII